jgi:hypothetical protein
MEVAGESENYGPEQERLNNVFGARLHITALRAASGPGVEFLEYLTPRDGRSFPPDEQANDLIHWQTNFVGTSADEAALALRNNRTHSHSAITGPGSFPLEPSRCRKEKLCWFATLTVTPSKFRRKAMKNNNRVLSLLAVLALGIGMTAFAAKMETHTSGMFQGAKANTGTVTHYVENGKSMLKVSADFKVPDTPAPTWRVVDSKGVIYTLDAFKIKGGGGEKREVVVPAYVHDIVKVQVYCAWAEVLLGEAAFAQPVM